MNDGNIEGQQSISPGFFELDLDSLEQSQVGSEGDPGSTEGNPPLQVEVDPKYAGLPEAEAIARTIQSKYDKLNMDFLQAQKDLQSYSMYKEVMSDLYDNDDALYAFLNERKPELINTRDIKSEITKHIATKFGEGFKPTLSREEAERNDPGGQDWLYYRELDKVTEKLGSNGSYSKFSTLKEFKEAREAAIKAEDAKIEAEISDAKIKYKATDAEVDWARDWVAKLQFGDIIRIARFLRKFQNAPAMANIPGNPTQAAMSKSRQQFRDSLR